MFVYSGSSVIIKQSHCINQLWLLLVFGGQFIIVVGSKIWFERTNLNTEDLLSAKPHQWCQGLVC